MSESKKKPPQGNSAAAAPLRKNVKMAIRRYLEDMGECQPDNLYRTLMAEVEPPLIQEVLKHTGGNQSRAAGILGMTRNTLRKKLNQYQIDPGIKET